MEKSDSHSHRTLIFNSFYNFFGKLIPLVVAVLTIPIFIHKMGVERFGILALVWTLIGYFGVFDLGVGRATTKFTAEYLARNWMVELPELIWTSWWLLISLGVLGGLAAFLIIPVLIERILNVPPLLMGEAREAFLIMSLSLPFVFSAVGARGVLEAQQRFGLINAINVPAGICNFLAPLPIFLFTNSLVPVVVVTVLLRLLVWVVFFYFGLRSLPDLTQPRLPTWVYMRKLLGFGGWLTVTNIVSPMMANMDRFLIGSFLTIQAVSYYVVPFDLVARLSIIPASITAVLFPAFSASGAIDRSKLDPFFIRSVKYIFIMMAPLVAGIIVMARPFLIFWLGSSFAFQSTTIMQILSVGVLINSLAVIPYGALQATGHPDLTAKLHLLELPLYLGSIWLFMRTFGLAGVAWAWTLRVSLDAALLFWWARRLIITPDKILMNIPLGLVCSGIGVAVLLLASCSAQNFMIRALLLVIILTILSFMSWRYLLDENEKGQFLSRASDFSHILARK